MPLYIDRQCTTAEKNIFLKELNPNYLMNDGNINLLGTIYISSFRSSPLLQKFSSFCFLNNSQDHWKENIT